MKITIEKIKRIILILVIFIIYTYIFKGYIAYLPTIPVYPNNKEEIKKMKLLMKKRTAEDVRFLYLTKFLF